MVGLSNHSGRCVCFVSKNPLQFFSKRWIGNLNLLLFRKRGQAARLLHTLVHLLEALKVELVIVTGDLTSTSHKDEFLQAAAFVRELKERGMDAVVIPGNHDHYTKRAFRKRRFYDFFPARLTEETGHALGNFCLKSHAVGVKPLAPHWWLVVLDTALATSLISSRGLFSFDIQGHPRRV